MAAMGGRPTMMQRFPDGASGKSFFQKRVPKGAPDWLETAVVSTPNGTPSDALVVADIAHVLWAVNLGCLGFHPWPFLAATPDVTDELRIDLDPSPGCDFDDVRRVAFDTRALFDELGMASYAKTTGSKGIHIHVRLRPEWDSYAVRAGAVALARELERRHTDRITAAWWKEERGARVFVDYNQNAPHKTVFGAWSVRSRVAAQVSTPVSWDELATVNPDELTLPVVMDRIADGSDPWAPMYGDAAGPRTTAGDVGGRHGGRAHGRPVAARLSEDAERAAPGRAEPGCRRVSWRRMSRRGRTASP